MTDVNRLILDVTVSDDGSTVTVAVGGEIDVSNADLLGGELLAAAIGGPRRLEVNFRAVEFIDSSGISALIACQRGLEALGVAFEVVGARDRPLRVIELTGVLGLLAPSVAARTKPCPECGLSSELLDPDAEIKEWLCTGCGHWFVST